MSVKEAQKHYTETIKAYSQLRKQEEMLKTEIKKRLDMEGENIPDLINNALMATNGSEDGVQHFPFDHLQEYHVRIKNFSTHFNMFDDSIDESTFVEVQKQIEIREAERSDMWKLWRDKLARWFMGVSVAVVLYSAFVALSDKWSFIKVPVRDMVIDKNVIKSVPSKVVK